MDLDTICESMPKIELHAHLNGSISEKALQNLITENGSPELCSAQLQLKSDTSRSFIECFAIFKLIHNVIRTPDILRRVTTDVISDFADDNVIYLELRTTPKAVHQIPSKRVYLESVITAILECKQNKSSISVKLLISIDREKGVEEGSENVDLAIEFMQKYPEIVVGVDLSGNPTTGNISWILPLLKKARDHGLKLACHLPEVINLDETDVLLNFDGIGRLGHGLYVHPTFGGTLAQWETLKLKRIPIEACITSNIISGVTESMEQHYVRVLHEEGIPFAICTDDSGVFNTTLSQEYLKFLQIVPTSLADLQILCQDSVSYAFCSAEEKVLLKETISKWWEANHRNLKKKITKK